MATQNIYSPEGELVGVQARWAVPVAYRHTYGQRLTGYFACGVWGGPEGARKHALRRERELREFVRGLLR